MKLSQVLFKPFICRGSESESVQPSQDSLPNKSEKMPSRSNNKRSRTKNGAMPQPSRLDSKFNEKYHKTAAMAVQFNPQSRHKATITTFPFDPPFNFQLENPFRDTEDADNIEEAGICIADSSSSVYTDPAPLQPIRSIRDKPHDQSQHRESTASSTTNVIHRNPLEHSIYCVEVSNLKLQIIELEYINTTLENKTRKYRREIRLFKQDVEGYKLDVQQLTAMLLERETEIDLLHEKITQILNQDLSPMSPPPLSTPKSIGKDEEIRNRHVAYFAKDRFDAELAVGGRRRLRQAERTDDKEAGR